MARRVSQTLEMVHGSGTLRAGDPGVDTPVHLERFPAAEEASNEDRLLTVVSLWGSCPCSASWSLAYLVHERIPQDRSALMRTIRSRPTGTLLDGYIRHHDRP